MRSDGIVCLQHVLHRHLIEAGCEPTEEIGPAIYRAFVDSPVDEGVLRAVFIDLDDDTTSTMSSFGESAISNVELDLARDSGDSFEVVVLAGRAWFRQSLCRDEILRINDPIASSSMVLASAIHVGKYAAIVEHRIGAIRQEKANLRYKLNHLLEPENWILIHYGEVSPDEFASDAERALSLYQSEDLWRGMVDTSRQAARWCWANDSAGPKLADVPWTAIKVRLLKYGEERGWSLE